MNNKKSYLKTIVTLILPYKRELITILVIIFCAMGIQIGLPILNQQMIDQGILGNNLKIVVQMCIILFVLFLVGQVLDYLQFVLFTKSKNKLHYKLQYEAVNHLMRMKVSKLNDSNYYKILKQIDFDVDNITKIMDKYIINAIAGTCKIIGGLIGLFIISWKLGLILLIFVPLKLIGVQIIYKWQTKHFEALGQAYIKNSFWQGDTFNGIVEIKLWNIFRQKLKEFKEYAILKGSRLEDLVFCSIKTETESVLAACKNCVKTFSENFLCK